MNAAPGVLFDDPALLPAYYENQAPTEKLYRTAMLQERHAIEQESPSSTLYTTRPVVDGQDERTEVQPVQVHDGASDAQAHQAPSTDTQYQAAGDLEYIEHQPGPESPHHSSVNHPRQDATISPCGEFDFAEVAMHDLPTPQFFNEAFEDGGFSTLHHGAQTDVEEATAYSDEQHWTSQDHTKSFRNDTIVQGYLDLACRSSFRLPHETVEDADCLDARELLSPLVEERPLTSRLIHGLLYMLVPGPLRILEVCSSAFDPEPSPEESPVDDFVAIIRRNAEAVPLLVLGIQSSKTLYILDSETVDLQSFGISWLIRPEWSTEHIDVWRSSPDSLH
jgi:hypothetical protein